MPTQSYIPPGEDHLPPYRCGVGIVVFNRKGQVLGCHRASLANKNTGLLENSLQWPQGGIDVGEDEEETAYRELFEEVGLPRTAVELLARAPEYTHYEFPDFVLAQQGTAEHPHKYRGQRHAWFAFLLTDDTHVFSFDHHHEVEFASVEWVDLDHVPAHVIDFKRQAYAAAAAMFAPLAEQLAQKT